MSAERPLETAVVIETREGRFQVKADGGGSTFLVDEPVASGGLGSGPNPYDLLSTALAACTSMTLRLYAERKKWPLERVQVNAIHRRDSLSSKDIFETRIHLEGPLDEGQVERMMEIAERCPVHQTLARGAELRTSRDAGPMAATEVRPNHVADMETVYALNPG
jgi:putative redox protein